MFEVLFFMLSLCFQTAQPVIHTPRHSQPPPPSSPPALRKKASDEEEDQHDEEMHDSDTGMKSNNEEREDQNSDDKEEEDEDQLKKDEITQLFQAALIPTNLKLKAQNTLLKKQNHLVTEWLKKLKDKENNLMNMLPLSDNKWNT